MTLAYVITRTMETTAINMPRNAPAAPRRPAGIGEVVTARQSTSAPPNPPADIAYPMETPVSASPITATSADAGPPGTPGLRRRHHQPAVSRMVSRDSLAPLLGDVDHAGGDPEVRREHADSTEFFVRHTHDGERVSVQPDACPHHRRAGLETPGPVAVAQHHNRTGSRHVALAGAECPPGDGGTPST